MYIYGPTLKRALGSPGSTRQPPLVPPDPDPIRPARRTPLTSRPPACLPKGCPAATPTPPALPANLNFWCPRTSAAACGLGPHAARVAAACFLGKRHHAAGLN